jgi:nucleotide-binding universal stress UspA family protein
MSTPASVAVSIARDADRVSLEPRSVVSNPAPTFKKILVATDFSSASQAAFATALSLCRALGSTLSVLHVFEEADVVASDPGDSAIALERLLMEAQNALEQCARGAREAGVPCEALLSVGVAALTIEGMIRTTRSDLAVLGTHALHGVDRLVFGSTAESVLRQTQCPVLTVGPQAARCGLTAGCGPVVFATDFHAETIHAIRYAAAFAKASGSALHCLHVLPRSLESESRAIIPQILIDALEHVASTSDVLIDQPLCVTTFGSEVSYALVEYARQHKARMIVLGVRHASLLASHIPAHIAYRVITEAPCAVLTIAYPA